MYSRAHQNIIKCKGLTEEIRRHGKYTTERERERDRDREIERDREREKEGKRERESRERVKYTNRYSLL